MQSPNLDKCSSVKTNITLDWKDEKLFTALFAEMQLTKRDKQKKLKALNCILANLKLVDDTDFCLRVTKRKNNYKKSRYNEDLFVYANFVNIYNKLVELGYVYQIKGYYDRTNLTESKSTRLFVNPKLRDVLRNSELVFLNEKECVVLTDKQNGKKSFVEYIDNDETCQIRGLIQYYNSYINKQSLYSYNHNYYHNISYNTSPHYTITDTVSNLPSNNNKILRYNDDRAFPIKSYIKAIFCRNDFSKGGRLYTSTQYGVQNIKKEFRNDILINGGKTVELDFKSLHLTMLYHLEGMKYNEDAYDLGLNKELRPLIKKMTLISINAKRDSDTIKAVKDEIRKEKIKGNFENVDLNDLLNKIKDKHKAISKYLCSDYGVTLQNLDGKIMLDILTRAVDKDIVALPIHDSVIVRKENE